MALHDLRISEGCKNIAIIEGLRRRFRIPLTIHLICDAELPIHPELSAYLQDLTHSGGLEIVFHGLRHTCSKDVASLGAFYHKHQAEYLDNDAGHQAATKRTFRALAHLLQRESGICPPCWLATRENHAVFRALNPLYIETLLSLHFQDKRITSPVLSLGSPNGVEIFFLKKLAGAIFWSSALFGLNRVRIVIHTCDLASGSLPFFEAMIAKFNLRGFKPALLRELG